MTIEDEYVGKFEVIFEPALGYELGDQVVRFMKKNRGKKSRETIPLNMY